MKPLKWSVDFCLAYEFLASKVIFKLAFFFCHNSDFFLCFIQSLLLIWLFSSSVFCFFFLPAHGVKSVINFHFVLSSVFLFLQLALFISSVIIGKEFYINKRMIICHVCLVLICEVREKGSKCKRSSCCLKFTVYSFDLPSELRDVISSSTDLKTKINSLSPIILKWKKFGKFFLLNYTYKDHQLFFFFFTLKEPVVFKHNTRRLEARGDCWCITAAFFCSVETI